jgi:hypothetical protein
MKIFSKIMVAGVALVGLASCSAVSTDLKDIKLMQIKFKPLTRADFTLVGNLSAEATLTSGKGGGAMAPKLSNGKPLAKTFRNNMKEGKVTSYESTEMLYFAPGQGEVITGSLYENDIFNLIYTPKVTIAPKKGFFELLKKIFGVKPKTQAIRADLGMQFAYYALNEKYPEVDYFINVRFDRKITTKGSNTTETVIVKADGLKLRTD